jgi:hypothetical protein
MVPLLSKYPKDKYRYKAYKSSAESGLGGAPYGALPKLSKSLAKALHEALRTEALHQALY